MNRLKLLSLNVRGFGSASKSIKIVQELGHLNCDVFLLQETHVSCKKQADRFEKLWKGKCFWSFGTGKSAGVAVLFSPKFSGKIVPFLIDSDGRILSLLIDYHGLYLNIVNLYSPNAATDRKSFLFNLHSFFLSQGLLVIGGDFNCINNILDKFNCSVVPSADKTSLVTLMGDFSLIDVWRKQNPRKVSFTWSNSDRTQPSRIDRFFIAKSLFSKGFSCEILPCVLSDHDFIKLDVSLEGVINRGAGVWRFNNSLLSDPYFRNVLKSVMADFKLKILEFVSLREWWDALKVVIRKTSINFSVRKHRLQNQNRIALTKQLIRAKNSSQSSDVINDLENQLSALISKEAERAKIRSRAQWFEEGEKPTRYFFRLEQTRAVSNFFVSLFDESGVEKTSQSDLEEILTQFYRNLFTSDSLDMQIQTDIIDALEFSLTNYEREVCEGLFTIDELFVALKGLQTGKSPGSDGLSTGFYLCFWEDLGKSLLSVLNESFHAGSLAESQYEGLLRLIHKKDDRHLLKNWRLISLLNTDYKLASKIITERLKKVMASIVHQDQSCGVLGRSIFSNPHLVRDTLDFIDKTNDPAIVLMLDQEKAFHRVDHEFMLGVLRKFGLVCLFVPGSEFFMRMLSLVSWLTAHFLALSISNVALARAVLYLPFFRF